MPPKSTASPKSGAATGLTPKKSYLIAYNAVSCALWATILYRTATIAGPDLLGGGAKKEGGIGATLKLNLFGEEARGYERLFGETGEFVKWAQTAAMMEIVHSLVGEFILFGGGWEEEQLDRLGMRKRSCGGLALQELEDSQLHEHKNKRAKKEHAKDLSYGYQIFMRIMLTISRRPRQRVRLHNCYASRQPLPPRLGNLRPVPFRTGKQHRILDYARRMEHHRGHQILILCLPFVWLCAWFHAVLEIQHILHSVPIGYLE